MELGVVAVIHNSARTRQKCIVVERRELLRDSGRHEKGATRIIRGISTHRAPDGKRKKDVESGIRESSFTRERERRASRERLGWATCPGEILGHYFGLVPPCVRPPEMNMQEPSGEYLRREHLYVYAGFQKMKPTRTGAALPLAKLHVEYVRRARDRSLLIAASYSILRNYRIFAA